ncbi:MAG: fibronectin type III domain-containing protein [Acidobacteriota bacterium]|nr:fibronectin type III domain-containing protein [Acidobacteriota bacterium]
MRSHFCIQLLFWLVLLSSTSCGGKPGTPTAGTASPTGPTAPQPIAGPPSNLVVVPQQRNSQGSIYELRWTAPSGSVTPFAVEVGSSTRASDIGVFEAPSSATTYSLTTQHRGPVFVRVRARNAGGLGDPSNEFRIEDQRDVIEALFLSTGALRSPDHQPICQFTSLFPDVVEGFSRGTTVTALLSNSLPEPHKQAAARLFDDMTAATMGSLQVMRNFSDDRNYMEAAFRRNEFCGTNELVILDVADGQPFCGTLGCGGGRLAPRATTALFQNAFVIAQRTDAVFGNSTEAVIAHELSHAVGLCHIASPIMGEFTLMGTSAIRGVTRLSSVELAAIRSVYGAGLGPGSTRQDLLSSGLVGPR